MNPRVRKVIPTEKYKLLLTFTNGELGIYDCSGLLNFGVFQEIQDENYFNKVSVLDGTVFWPHEQDICPDTLYLDSIKQEARDDYENLKDLHQAKETEKSAPTLSPEEAKKKLGI